MLFEKSNQPYDLINQKIKEACQKAGRAENSVQMMAVTKNQSPEAILPLLKAGHLLFGENRVQEAAQKWKELKNQFPEIHLHLIGPLQTNKVSQALEVFDVIESVDRPRLVEALAKAWENPSRRTRKILIQVNTGREPQKSGVMIEEIGNLIEMCTTFNLPLAGLMGIPPVDEDPVPHFQMLVTLAREHNLPELSMGMSDDYETAIAHGATSVRVGTALFKV